MTVRRLSAMLLLAATAAACSPAAENASAGNMSEGAGNLSESMAEPHRRPSSATRLSKQELAFRIGPQCAEPGAVDYPPAENGAGRYIVTCGKHRFRVDVAADGRSEVTPIAR